MNNIFSLKLKAIKNELLALKTAHIKGIGNLRMFSSSIKVVDSEDYSLLSIIVDFDSTSIPYPFVQVFGSVDANNNPTFTTLGGGYANNGYTSITTGTGFVRQQIDTIYVESTSPITNIRYTWGD